MELEIFSLIIMVIVLILYILALREVIGMKKIINRLSLIHISEPTRQEAI